jgi:hypothetical protein
VGDHPTFRVRGKSFVFCDADAAHLTVKLPKDEAPKRQARIVLDEDAAT